MKNFYTFLAILLFISFSTSAFAQEIYGTTPYGGIYQSGVLFKYTPTANITTIFNFGQSGGWKSSAPGEVPYGSLLRATDGLLYGITKWGGPNFEGTVYSYDLDADTMHVIFGFTYNDGEVNPGLIQAANGKIYGLTVTGGTNNGGQIFAYTPSSGNFSFIHSFTTSEGQNPEGGMTLHSDGKAYFVTNSGGTNYYGCLLQFTPTTNAIVVKKALDTTSGHNLQSPLYSAPNGKLYGVFSNGGSGYKGTLIEYDPTQNQLNILYSFSDAKGSADGFSPKASPVMYQGNIYGATTMGGSHGFGVLYKYNLTSSQYTKLLDFDSTNTGAWPEGSLSLSNDGWLYGTCRRGGAFGKGIFFKYNVLNGTFVKLKDFNGLNGEQPRIGGFIDLVELSFHANDTILTAPPFTVQFTNSTNNAQNFSWQWQFGDGGISYDKNPTHTYTTNGTYTVTLIANDTTNHRQDTLMKQDYIALSGATPCPATANITPTGMVYICPGDSVMLKATGYDASFNYQWLRSGLFLNGETDTVFYAKQGGYYQLRVDNGTCWNFSNVTLVQEFPTQPPLIEEYGPGLQPCTNDSLKLKIDTGYSSYLWSNGDTGNFTYVKTSGFYTVTISDNNGCSVTSPIDTINASLVNAPKICIVGVDSVSGHNMIVWNQSQDTRIDSFRVYKEGPVNNEFHLIGAKERSETAMLIDSNSDPRVTSYRYRLMAIDSCGSITPVGPYHRTMHLIINYGQNGAWNLWWNPYEGTELGTYYIYRSTDSTQMQLIASLPSSNHTYTDLNPPAGDVFYMIKVSLPNACNPGGGVSYSMSSSNLYNTRDANPGIRDIKMHDISVSVFPNPNTGRFTIKVNSKKSERLQLMIFNGLGSLVAQEQIDGSGNISRDIDLGHLSKGMYYLRLQSDKDVVMKKIIIQ